MATITWYGDGTATVAAGSRTVTGTNTGWLTEVAGLTPIKAGDKFGIHVGRPIVIEKIISNTELLLADDWPGPAQTNAPYKVELTSPTIAAVEAMRRLLASLSNGNLESLSEITLGTDDIPIGIGPGVFGTIKRSDLSGVLATLIPAENKLPYFTGANSAALTDLSAFSRTILDDTSGAAMFATMGASQVLSGNGRETLPGGLQFKWGTSSLTDTDQRITFPLAYPAACFGVLLTCGTSYTETNRLIAASTSNVTASGFDIRSRNILPGSVAGQNGVIYHWIAVGY
ncbi:gp53-like domain-containing protein [Agrobacterium sp. DKPNP3]|uniref:gp53-like domain-containing protein n=1 Tax=Agrobacterium sp. DKPNP3 TaxID=3457323 RepID=UPI004044D257